MQSSHITQFEAIFQYATEGILTTDTFGKIRTVNPSACKLFQYEEEDLVGQKIECLIPKRFKNHQSHRENFVKQPRARSMGSDVELFGLKKNGEEFPLEVSLSPYESNGEVFVIAFVVDVTLRKEVEKKEKNYREELEQEVNDRTLILKEAIQKLEKTKQNLDESLRREKEANSMKSKFVSIASHEFRTPLSTMLSSLVLIEKYRQKGDIEKQEKHTERIKKSIRSLTEILNDILSINKLEEGKTVTQAREFVLKEMLEAIISELSLITNTNQVIEMDFKPNINFVIEQDANLLGHILTNLLSNAIKFSPENSVISLIVDASEDTVIFEVKDQGIGIPETNLEQLFTRFYRADNAGQIKGTGLGLSIVKQHCELLGGDVSVKTKENKGSTFKVVLPIKID